MITTKSCSQHTVLSLYMWGNQHTTHRKAIGNTLSQCNYIGLNVSPLVSKISSTTA